MSGLIFVALFVGWALYLIPKFMRDHQELATTRSLQDFSARLRVFASAKTVTEVEGYGPEEPTVEISMDEVAAAVLGDDGAPRPVSLPTLAAAKRAAARRRRVLLALLLATVAVSVLALTGVGPAWTPALPALLTVVFLVVARRSVRRLQAARRAQRQVRILPEAPAVPEPVRAVEEPVAVDEPVEIDESDRLWDPVALTLPTYLDKPVARRTVTTIDLAGDVTSSGHDAADSELVREVDAEETPVDLEAPRRAAGA